MGRTGAGRGAFIPRRVRVRVPYVRVGADITRPTRIPIHHLLAAVPITLSARYRNHALWFRQY